MLTEKNNPLTNNRYIHKHVDSPIALALVILKYKLILFYKIAAY